MVDKKLINQSIFISKQQTISTINPYYFIPTISFQFYKSRFILSSPMPYRVVFSLENFIYVVYSFYNTLQIVIVDYKPVIRFYNQTNNLFSTTNLFSFYIYNISSQFHHLMDTKFEAHSCLLLWP